METVSPVWYDRPMEKPPLQQIIPADFPELSKLVWNRDPHSPVDAEDVFHIYERNWRFVDTDALGARERQLIDDLGHRFGHGFGLVRTR
nr:hypothetical protein [uncultured Gellertiella sp.]